MNDHAYLYANTSDKSIIYDLAARCALVEVPPVPGGGLKRIPSSFPLPTSISGQVVARPAAASSLRTGGTSSCPGRCGGNEAGRGWYRLGRKGQSHCGKGCGGPGAPQDAIEPGVAV